MTIDRFTRRNRTDLTEKQRLKAIDYLSTKAEVSFSSLAKKLELTDTESFNLESNVRQSIYGLETAALLSNKKCFGELWPSDIKQQDNIVRFLLEENEDDTEKWLKQNYPLLSEEQIDAVFKATLKFEDGTLRYSTEAIEKLIPELQKKGINDHYQDEYQAIIACGWQYANHYTGEIMMDELPYYGKLLERKTQSIKYGSIEEKEYGRIANPTVHVALNQLRHVINDILKTYGHPKEIAVEFSRELKLTKKEKTHRSKINKDNQDKNRRYDDQIRENGLVPNDEYRKRLKLWEEQDYLCAYSLEKLGIARVLSDEVEIDHILPFSRTFDDTNANKVIALRRINRLKSNKTPYEAFASSGVVDYQVVLLNIEKTIPYKKCRFLESAMDKFEEDRNSGDKGWQARQLNDTSYMARVAREYMRYIVGDRVQGYPAVDTYSGGITAKLRNAWGLNSLLNPDASDEERDKKNRDDHRHHAIDALVIACTNRSMLQRISIASGNGEKTGAEWVRSMIKEAPPYIQYNHNDLQIMVDAIVISHKPDHKTTGNGGGDSTSAGLHDDTFYGIAHNQGHIDENHTYIKDDQVRLVTSPLGGLKSLKEKDVVNVCDPLIRERLLAALRERRDDEKAEDIITRFANDNKIHRVRIFNVKSKKSMRAIRDKQGRSYRYVATGGNHHIDIFCPIKDVELSDGRKYKAGQWYA